MEISLWFGCTSKTCVSSVGVFSPFTAAKATFALKAGLWFRRDPLVMSSPDGRRYSPQSGGKSTYRPVQFLEASSVKPRYRLCYPAFQASQSANSST